jgi:uncharacterized protein YbjT (DUF2867 family)
MTYTTASPPAKILLLGAGELGTALNNSLSQLPNAHTTIGVRSPEKYSHLASPTTTLTQLDLTSDSESLAQIFSHYDIIISATGFAQAPGTVTKLADEALAAGRLRRDRGQGKLWFFPWQWGVDYDVTGDGAGLMPLFGEQKRVRDQLRQHAADSHVAWTVVSTGIFMSFLFEPAWGMVQHDENGGPVTVRCLNNWQHRITVTDVVDIGRVLARIVARDVPAEDRVVFVAGDTVSYDELAKLVQGVRGEEVIKEEWSVPYLEEELAKDPDNGLKRYRLVFAREGVWWNKAGTVNDQLGMNLKTVKAWVEGRLSNK